MLHVAHVTIILQTFKKQLITSGPNYDKYDFWTKKFNFRDATQPIQVTVKTDAKEWIMTVQEGEEGVSLHDSILLIDEQLAITVQPENFVQI